MKGSTGAIPRPCFGSVTESVLDGVAAVDVHVFAVCHEVALGQHLPDHAAEGMAEEHDPAEAEVVAQRFDVVGDLFDVVPALTAELDKT